jgi:hypothetical protein
MTWLHYGKVTYNLESFESLDVINELASPDRPGWYIAGWRPSQMHYQRLLQFTTEDDASEYLADIVDQIENGATVIHIETDEDPDNTGVWRREVN